MLHWNGFFDAAQTNAVLLTASATERIAVSFAKASANNSNTVDVSVRIGFGTSTLPAITVNSLTGNSGIVLSQGALGHGSGEVNGNGAAAFCVGGYDEDLLITNTVPTSGQIRVLVAYKKLA